MKRASVVALPVCRVPVANGAHDKLIDHEWIVTNGMGGYSSGTVAGVITRRYHGLLVAALQNPFGRTVMLNAIDDGLDAKRITAFALDSGVPTWRYETDGTTIEKRIVMPHRQNTTIIQYRLVAGARATLRAMPAVHFRGYETGVSAPLQHDYAFTSHGDHFLLTASGYPPLRVAVEGHVAFVLGEQRREQIQFAVEESRGFTARGALWSPGTFTIELAQGESAAIIASTEEIDMMRALSAEESFAVARERAMRLISGAALDGKDSDTAQLVLAADQFVIKPVGRLRDTVRAAAVGDELRTVIAGYHWFTDWGRDTMISLEGLTLATGRHREAGFILRTFAQYVRDGLIPNLFPDGSDEGLYHTADATLWFFHAIQRYADVTGYWTLVEEVLPTMRRIAEAHIAGTRFGIGVDHADALLHQGADGYQLTWMDAKVDGWVVTPRRGKAVEINALWYNALCLLSGWERDFGDHGASRRYADLAARVHESFNRRFWMEQKGYLYDVIDGPDGDDAACRPNQVFAISLPNPVLDASRWESVLSVVHKKLLTPVGLRSLSPDHPDFKSRYFGDLRARDAAYHQGTVWAWLIGPWIDAWLKVHPDDHAGARKFLDGLIAHLPDFGVGTIAEIFDAEPPYTPRGCIAQAWSVAEVLRCLVKTSGRAVER
ncbi:MAG TPA: amylo-alpha-1,6-glucosidase [Gemmatimonadaceae bacterium]|nr:amylo-alpha-1,6-glucosidase [Gemmatimonadaceae bacterium]